MADSVVLTADEAWVLAGLLNVLEVSYATYEEAALLDSVKEKLYPFRGTVNKPQAPLHRIVGKIPATWDL